MIVSLEVYVFPRNSVATRWLVAQFDALQDAFVRIHLVDDLDVASHHPHGLLLERANPEARDPDDPDVHVYVGAHWNRNHEALTKAHVRQALATLRADLSAFTIEGTSDADQEG